MLNQSLEIHGLGSFCLKPKTKEPAVPFVSKPLFPVIGPL